MRIPRPQTAAQARWIVRGLWLLAIVSLGLPWLLLKPGRLEAVYSARGLDWPLLIAVLLVSGFIQAVMALAVTYSEMEAEAA